MDFSNIKIAVVGCGYWGKNLVRNFHELGALKAVCDGYAPQAQKMAETYGVPALSFEEVLKDPEIQGVVIAAPAELHHDLAKKVLLADKHVFVEKPLSLEVKNAEELCQLAQEQQKILMVGHLLQYHPAFLELKNRVGKGDIGKLQYLYSNRLNFGKIRQEENSLWSFAPHDISMILSIAKQEPESVYATGSCHVNAHIHDTTMTHLHFKNGVDAHVFVSWLHPFKEQKLVVVGSEGMFVFDDGQPWAEKLQFYPHKVNWVEGVPTPDKAACEYIALENSEPLKLECAHFLESISKQTAPRTDGQEGLRVLKVLDAAQKSLGQKKSLEPTSSFQNDLKYFAHATAAIDSGCDIGVGSKIWHYSHILSGTKIGKNAIIGQNVMIGPDVVVGDQCKIQNNVSLYKGITLEEGVFCGPSCVFTNVNTPRACIERKDQYKPTHVEKWVTIGANATIICGVRLGAYSLIGAGAVVTKDVKPHTLMVGNPARQIGWVTHAGEVLREDMTCPREGRKYQVVGDTLEEVLCNIIN
ncbi:MAG: oxidoreductase [Alphaproteobacteria bacterium]|nr:MAG: oxidoreductase [Alphaproteobacteria bacterium]